LPDGIGPVLGKDLEHEKPVHGRARSVEEGDEAATRQKRIFFKHAATSLNKTQ
jgi:hypothetical protein